MLDKPIISKPLPKLEEPIDYRTILKFIYISLFVLSFILGLGGGVLIKWHSELPSLEQLENIQPNLVTKIYSADSVLLKEFYIERRFIVSYDQLPKQLINAVIVTEDRDFFNHWGMNIRRTFGALWQDILLMKKAQGASTLTQQLARNLFLSSEKSVSRKIKEAMTAIQIEKRYTKKEILEFYLNQIYMGGGIYGVQAASKKYFNRDVSQLTISQCALMAGIFRRPEAYRPDKQKNKNRAIKRRNLVLRSMREMGCISKEEYDTAIKEPLETEKPETKETAFAPYFTELVRSYIERKYGSKKLYTGGLKVYTTLRQKDQYAAEDSLKRYIKRIQNNINAEYIKKYRINKKTKIPLKTLINILDSLYYAKPNLLKKAGLIPQNATRLKIVQSALIALDTKTRGIIAMIGGRNYNESKFNRATQALRQPGSAFKPIVYACAIKNGSTPSTVVMDQPLSLKTATGMWRPENYNKKFSGKITLRNALKRSVNIAAIQLMKQMGTTTVIKFAKKLGITTHLDPILGLAIGVSEVKPIEITNVYAIFASGGLKIEPYFIEKILDNKGTVLEQHTQRAIEILDPKTSYIMTSMLETVIRNGTGYRSRFPGGFLRPAGGKTGTTNDYTDAWFVGFTPQITCGVWTGIDSKSTLGRNETGSKAALPIWTAYMKVAHENLPEEDFTVPEGIIKRVVCTESGLLARTSCPNTMEEIFIEGSQPTDSCNISHFKSSRKSSVPLF